MATRQASSYQFDHGAQFFTARSEQFQKLLNKSVPQNLVQVWHPRVLTLDIKKKPYKREWFEPHFIAAPGMSGLCKALAQGLDVTLNSPVGHIEADEQGWLLHDAVGEQIGQFDWVISTAPAPLADELLPDYFAHKPELSAVNFSPCFSVMLGFESALKLNFDAAVVRNSPLGWIAVDSKKPGRESSFSLLAQSNNIWAQSQAESTLEDVCHRMLEALDEVLESSLPQPDHIAIHRWDYAKAEIPSKKPFLVDESNRLAACGDWCGGNRVEDAFLSGLKLGEHLRNFLPGKT